MENKLPPIHTIRRLRVMLDSDLARLYGVRTSQLNQAIKRNVGRFPTDFRFQLTKEEYANSISQSEDVDLKEDALNSSQFVTSSRKHRGGAYVPWAFTEHGALMGDSAEQSARGADEFVRGAGIRSNA